MMFWPISFVFGTASNATLGVSMNADTILSQAQFEMADRSKTYDKPEGERSMAATTQAFSAITGIHMTEQQGWLFMATLKMVRSQQGQHRPDNFVDGSAYMALAGECVGDPTE